MMVDNCYPHKEIFTIISTSRKIAKSVKHEIRSPNGGIYARMEIDNHADTHALGSNCTVLHWTGRSCNVSAFSEHYLPMKDVEIVTGATAYDDPITGESTILIFHEALWLGEQMVNSLINPNQCRVHGISICDDPFDPHRSLGIYDSSTNINISFKMYGTIAAVATRSISLQELQTTRQLVMCSTTPWEPSRVVLPCSIPVQIMM
jgi:hypothetical protein